MVSSAHSMIVLSPCCAFSVAGRARYSTRSQVPHPIRAAANAALAVLQLRARDLPRPHLPHARPEGGAPHICLRQDRPDRSQRKVANPWGGMHASSRHTRTLALHNSTPSLAPSLPPSLALFLPKAPFVPPPPPPPFLVFRIVLSPMHGKFCSLRIISNLQPCLSPRRRAVARACQRTSA